MKKLVSLTLLGLLLTAAVSVAEEYTVVSPGGKAKVVVTVDKKAGITAGVFYQDKEITRLGPISMEIGQGKVFGNSPVVRKVNK